MADVVWEDMNCRARKVEGGYESVLNWDEEELVVNYFPFAETVEVLEEELGRKPTPEEMEEEARMWASDPEYALDALPPFPSPDDEEGFVEIKNNWERVRKDLGMLDLVEEMIVRKGERDDLKKRKVIEDLKGAIKDLEGTIEDL